MNKITIFYNSGEKEEFVVDLRLIEEYVGESYTHISEYIEDYEESVFDNLILSILSEKVYNFIENNKIKNIEDKNIQDILNISKITGEIEDLDYESNEDDLDYFVDEIMNNID